MVIFTLLMLDISKLVAGWSEKKMAEKIFSREFYKRLLIDLTNNHHDILLKFMRCVFEEGATKLQKKMFRKCVYRYFNLFYTKHKQIYSIQHIKKMFGYKLIASLSKVIEQPELFSCIQADLRCLMRFLREDISMHWWRFVLEQGMMFCLWLFLFLLQYTCCLL